MLFNSIDFAVFFPIVFVFYWIVAKNNLKLQNLVVVISSLIFYGWWDWRFLILMIISASVDYFAGILLMNNENIQNRKLVLWVSMSTNLGILGLFKYYNFFLDNIAGAFTFFGANIATSSLNIVLPVGISFYTFQSMSYSVDVYRKQLTPTRNYIDFLAFVTFFPQLVAGPIERATNLLPQFYIKRVFNDEKAIDGLRQILWGLFKKVVIADNCAFYANMIFNNSSSYSGSTLILGVFFFTIQIYGDFSGYSDIAIGLARLFGFSLMRNFAFPYFSRDIAEFWRRWHISLSTWFRDYVYFPLGGSKCSKWMQVRNTFIIFMLSGFWHGANWTFIIWGALNAVYFIPLLVLKKNRINLDAAAQNRFLPTIKEFFQIGITFILVMFAWIFFRATSLTHAIEYIAKIFSLSTFTVPRFDNRTGALYLAFGIFGLFFMEWIARHEHHALASLETRYRLPLRWGIYFLLAYLVLNLGLTHENPFIYFQF